MQVTGDGVELRLEGRLDASTLSDARLALNDAIDRGTGDLVVDLRDVAIGDRTGLGLVIAAHYRARRRGRRLVFTGVSPAARRLLCRTQLALVLR
jgi:anti-sigma B factor antagonist